MSKRDGAGLWKALKEQEIEDDLDELEAMPDADLDAYIAANGGDPAKIRADGRTLVNDVLERRKELAWHGEMHAKLAKFRAQAETMRTKTKLPRAEILARLEVARKSPRFAAPVAMMFQKKTPEACTDDELVALLDSIGLLAMLEDEGKS